LNHAGFRLRFETLDGTPIQEPEITVSLSPCPPPVYRARRTFGADRFLPGGIISWSLSGGDVKVGKTVSYAAVSPVDAFEDGLFSGSLEAAGEEHPITGAAIVRRVVMWDDQGFIRSWLLLGPFSRDVPGANPPVAVLEQDYLIGFLPDGTEVDERSISAYEGLEVDVDYAAAASSGLIRGGGLRDEMNPGGIPRWFVWMDEDDG